MRHGSLGTEQHPVEIDGEHAPPLLGRYRCERRVVGDRGIGHQDVELSPGGNCRRDRAHDAAAISDVDRDRLNRQARAQQVGDDGLERCLVDIAEGDARSFLEKDARRRKTDAAGRPGDEGDATLEASLACHHASFCRIWSFKVSMRTAARTRAPRIIWV